MHDACNPASRQHAESEPSSSFGREDFETDPILIAAREAVIRTRREQGLPRHVTDATTISRVAALCQAQAVVKQRKAA